MKLIKMLRQKVYEAFSETLESQRLLRLGKISHGKKLVARTRKYVIQHQDWSRLGMGFLYQGRTQLPFCAMLGPIFTIESKTRRYARLRTILLQYKPDSSVEAFALPVGKGSKLLADELLLSKDEAEALEAMLKAGKEVLGESDELRLTYVPLEQEIIPHQARVSCTTCSQEQAFQVLTHIGQIGREIFLAGLLNQLSVFCPDQFRPCLMVRLIGTSQTLETVRLLLRAVNFSSWITGEGTAPPILRTSECSTPPRYPGLALYRLDGKRDLLLSTLERHHQIQSRSEATPSPFPAVPLLLTENCALRGYVWNIELMAVSNFFLLHMGLSSFGLTQSANVTIGPYATIDSDGSLVFQNVAIQCGDYMTETSLTVEVIDHPENMVATKESGSVYRGNTPDNKFSLYFDADMKPIFFAYDP